MNPLTFCPVVPPFQASPVWRASEESVKCGRAGGDERCTTASVFETHLYIHIHTYRTRTLYLVIQLGESVEGV